MADKWNPPIDSDGGDELRTLEQERLAQEKRERQALDKAFGMYGYIVMPGEAQAPILNRPVRTVLHQWLFELNAEDELAAVGVSARRRMMLSGPPGCGKTTLAHHVAARLGVPMVVVQSHTLISKYIGETGENLGKLFRSARRDSNGVALFFDEFDAMTSKREDMGGSSGGAERVSIVTALLQEMDRYEGLLFAATNVTNIIDRAIWRRFNMQVEIGLPGDEERAAIIAMYMQPFVMAEDTLASFVELFEGASPALIRECMEQMKRSLVLSPAQKLSMELPDMLRRLVLAVQPADDGEPPRLWANTSPMINATRRLSWPPAMGGAA